MGLYEIDKEATKGKTKDMSDEDLLILNMMRTGSAWNRAAAYWAGQNDNQECLLCGKKESYDHIWSCKVLEHPRKDVNMK